MEFCDRSKPGASVLVAQRLLGSGAAWTKLQVVYKTQGGLCEPQRARLREPVLAERDGMVHEIDSQQLARMARLAGAPKAPAAGLELHVKLRNHIERDMSLFTVHAEALGELDYASNYLEAHPLIDMGDSR